MADYAAPYAAFKYAVLVIAFFTLLAWVLLLGGISALEKTPIGNRSTLGLPWFILWFQLLLIIAAFVVEFQNRQTAWRGTLNILLAINTTLAIIQCEKFFQIKDDNAPNSGVSGSRINATLAGFIILSIFNLLLIILSGSRGALEDNYGENKDIGIASYPRATGNVNTAPAVPSGVAPRGPAAV